MRTIFSRFTFRNPSPRVWLGISLIGVSIVGVTVTIASEREGATILLASQFISAGSLITESDVTTARLIAPNGVFSQSPGNVVGMRAAEDIVAGDIINEHTLDASINERRIMSIPLDYPPAKVIKPGDRLQLWFSSANASVPPILVARDVILISIQPSGFGDGDIIEISTSSRDEIPVISAMATDGTLVAVKGEGPS